MNSLTIGKGEDALKFGSTVPSLQKKIAMRTSAKIQMNYPIVAALVKAEDILGNYLACTSKNGMQSRFVADFFRMCATRVWEFLKFKA